MRHPVTAFYDSKSDVASQGGWRLPLRTELSIPELGSLNIFYLSILQ
jgi:hypothetical protein